MNGRKTILLVDDDAGTLRVLSSGLANTLGMFDVATAGNGREAIEVLDARPVDVVVTDLAMPVMDGFALIGHLTNRDATVPVVVLSALAPHDIDVGLDGYHGLTVLTKPAGHEDVASAVLQVLEQVERGQVEGIPLPSVLQLVEAERRTCTLVVTSGRRRGRLHFESGRLINAFSDDFGAEGEAAAHDVLSWERTAIEFDRLPEGIRRLIHVPTQAFLVEVARRQDERQSGPGGHPPLPPRVATDRSADAGHGDAAATANPGPEAPPPSANGADAHQDAWATSPAAADASSATSNPWSHGPTFGDATLGPAAAPVPHEAPPTFETHAPDAANESAAESPVPDAAAATQDGGPDAHEPGHEATHEAPDAAIHDAPPVAGPEAAAPVAAPRVAPAALPSGGNAAGTTPTAEPPQGVRDLIAAIARLTERVHAADEALAAVATEVAAFHEAQRRYDEAVAQREAQREERRRRTVAARDDVAALAREILAKMDGLFDVLSDGEASTTQPGEARSVEATLAGASERPTAGP